jgi:hypothetical protein
MGTLHLRAPHKAHTVHMERRPMKRLLAITLTLGLLFAGASGSDLDAKKRPNHTRINERIVVNGDVQAEDETGPGARWIDPVVEVRYYGNDRFYPIHEANWNAFTAAMPPGTTVFVPVNGGTVCPERVGAPRPYITVCIEGNQWGFAAVTYWYAQSGVIQWADIRIDDRWARTENVHCHEAMHAVTGIRDGMSDEWDTSCIHGGLDYPGSFDIAFINQLYGTPGEPTPTPIPTPTPVPSTHPRCGDPQWANHHPRQCPVQGQGKRR